MRILIVEDDFTGNLLLKGYLIKYGECDVAYNGKSAMEIFKSAFLKGIHYDLICLDIMMPDLTGNEVLKKIRSIEREKGVKMKKAVKVIMTTALSDHNNIKEAFRSQCDAYLVKPIIEDKLVEILKELNLIP